MGTILRASVEVRTAEVWSIAATEIDLGKDYRLMRALGGHAKEGWLGDVSLFHTEPDRGPTHYVETAEELRVLGERVLQDNQGDGRSLSPMFQALMAFVLSFEGTRYQVRVLFWQDQ